MSNRRHRHNTPRKSSKSPRIPPTEFESQSTKKLELSSPTSNRHSSTENLDTDSSSSSPHERDALPNKPMIPQPSFLELNASPVEAIKAQISRLWDARGNSGDTRRLADLYSSLESTFGDDHGVQLSTSTDSISTATASDADTEDQNLGLIYARNGLSGRRPSEPFSPPDTPCSSIAMDDGETSVTSSLSSSVQTSPSFIPRAVPRNVQREHGGDVSSHDDGVDGEVIESHDSRSGDNTTCNHQPSPRNRRSKSKKGRRSGRKKKNAAGGRGTPSDEGKNGKVNGNHNKNAFVTPPPPRNKKKRKGRMFTEGGSNQTDAKQDLDDASTSCHDMSSCLAVAARVTNRLLMLLFRYHPNGILDCEMKRLYYKAYGEKLAWNTWTKRLLGNCQWVMLTPTENRGTLYQLTHEWLGVFVQQMEASSVRPVVIKHLRRLFRIFPNGISANCLEESFFQTVGLRFNQFSFSISDLMLELSKDVTHDQQSDSKTPRGKSDEGEDTRDHVFERFELNGQMVYVSRESRRHRNARDVSVDQILTQATGYQDMLGCILVQPADGMTGEELEDMFYSLFHARLMSESRVVGAWLAQICDPNERSTSGKYKLLPHLRATSEIELRRKAGLIHSAAGAQIAREQVAESPPLQIDDTEAEPRSPDGEGQIGVNSAMQTPLMTPNSNMWPPAAMQQMGQSYILQQSVAAQSVAQPQMMPTTPGYISYVPSHVGHIPVVTPYANMPGMMIPTNAVMTTPQTTGYTLTPSVPMVSSQQAQQVVFAQTPPVQRPSAAGGTSPPYRHIGYKPQVTTRHLSASHHHSDHGRMSGIATAPARRHQRPGGHRLPYINPGINKSPFKEDHATVFMGGFGEQTTIEDVVEVLKLKAVSVVHSTKISFNTLGYAFVTLLNSHQADFLVQTSPITIQGRSIDVRPFIDRERVQNHDRNRPAERELVSEMVKLLSGLPDSHKLSLSNMQTRLFHVFVYRLEQNEIRAVVYNHPEKLRLISNKGHEDYVTTTPPCRPMQLKEVLNSICGVFRDFDGRVPKRMYYGPKRRHHNDRHSGKRGCGNRFWNRADRHRDGSSCSSSSSSSCRPKLNLSSSSDSSCSTTSLQMLGGNECEEEFEDKEHGNQSFQPRPYRHTLTVREFEREYARISGSFLEASRCESRDTLDLLKKLPDVVNIEYDTDDPLNSRVSFQLPQTGYYGNHYSLRNKREKTTRV